MEFLKQIEEDIKKIQKEYLQSEPKLAKDEFAFNYWVLTKLYNVDEEATDNHITEYADDGIDSFVFYEDSKQLYLIQNKYYGENTKLDFKYVQNEFLSKPILTLLNNNYKRSNELQKIFNKYKDDQEFVIFLNLYITNNYKDQRIKELTENYREQQGLGCNVKVKVNYLDDIKENYYNDRKTEKRNFKFKFFTFNKGTILSINPNSYKLPDMIEAKYIFTPIIQLYNMYKEAYNSGYSLFEENIREYLGQKGANSKITQTLKDKEDRKNFFYYNNGITIICKSIKNIEDKTTKYQQSYEIFNPQIVNGGQTVNTIYEVLNGYHEDSRDKEFENTFVMVKLLVLESNNEEDKSLYKNIVKYNNSQNKIDEKNFEANKEIFVNLQRDLESLGFLLLIKQSDNYQFKEKKTFNQFRSRVEEYNRKFDLNLNNLDQIMIPLEKFLQVLLAFLKGGYDAFTKKSRVLKFEDTVNKSLIDYLSKRKLTNSDLINLYLFYLKSEKEKKSSEDFRSPVPYYVIGFLGNQLHSKNNDYHNTYREIFDSKKNIDATFQYFKNLSNSYKEKMKEEKLLEYNKMIKTQIDEEIYLKTKNDVEKNIKNFLPETYKIIHDLKIISKI